MPLTPGIPVPLKYHLSVSLSIHPSVSLCPWASGCDLATGRGPILCQLSGAPRLGTTKAPLYSSQLGSCHLKEEPSGSVYLSETIGGAPGWLPRLCSLPKQRRYWVPSCLEGLGLLLPTPFLHGTKKRGEGGGSRGRWMRVSRGTGACSEGPGVSSGGERGAEPAVRGCRGRW